ncbi:MAG: hypothetical protein LBR64_02900 [Dysgonamonadaceae bacterium]|jgi:hypothetical protein|nr:hypothetical protein [Dysgonamonadaceae bacterium]
MGFKSLKRFVASALLFFVSAAANFAQEQDFRKDILREAINPKTFLEPPAESKPDTVKKDLPEVPRKDFLADSKYKALPKMTFNHEINKLLLLEYYGLLGPKPKPEFELKLPSVDTQSDPNKLENIMKNRAENPESRIVSNGTGFTPILPIVRAATEVLMKTGILSDEPFVPKKSKKERALENIRAIMMADTLTAKTEPKKIP